MNRLPIEVILFDLGNVILPFNHRQIPVKLLPYSQGGDLKDSQGIFSYLFDSQKGTVSLYESGKISSEEFFRSLKESFCLSLSFEEFIPIWNDIFVEDEEVSKLIRSLKGSKRLGLLSNTNPLHFDYILPKFPILMTFEKWILSHEVGFKKPALEIFQKAIEWASIEPQRILFIDDLQKNVDAAVSLGMQTIHFISADQLKEELAAKVNSP
jgi:glucose-1-phosphatase